MGAFFGVPDTVAAEIRAAGAFNAFMGEFSLSDLPEPDLPRSIRLFGEEVMPALWGFEPY
jgi:hypothetical protein